MHFESILYLNKRYYSPRKSFLVATSDGRIGKQIRIITEYENRCDLDNSHVDPSDDVLLLLRSVIRLVLQRSGIGFDGVTIQTAGI